MIRFCCRSFLQCTFYHLSCTCWTNGYGGGLALTQTHPVSSHALGCPCTQSQLRPATMNLLWPTPSPSSFPTLWILECAWFFFLTEMLFTLFFIFQNKEKKNLFHRLSWINSTTGKNTWFWILSPVMLFRYQTWIWFLKCDSVVKFEMYISYLRKIIGVKYYSTKPIINRMQNWFP